jgi:flagellin-like protein
MGKLNFKRRDGVSTIIATILMVAVTVVLAGVLYVMIIGLGGGGGEDLQPLGSWANIDPLSNTSVELEFGAFTQDVYHIDIKIILESEEGYVTNITLPTNFTGLSAFGTVRGHNSTTITALYTDFGSFNTVNRGDKLYITGLDKGTYYTVTVYHGPTHSVVQMAGATGAFLLPG